jgi:hypothetical protein
MDRAWSEFNQLVDDLLARSGPPTFEEFWAHYPRKEAKLEAHRAWLRLPLSKRVLAWKIAALMEAFHERGYGPEVRFIPFAKKFLANERWNDWRNGVPDAWDVETSEGEQ